jgi:hypothetical protein
MTLNFEVERSPTSKASSGRDPPPRKHLVTSAYTRSVLEANPPCTASMDFRKALKE